MKAFGIILTFIASIASLSAKNPVEVGSVNWLRDYPTAIANAKKTDKPIFALFQEVPG